MVIVYLGTLGHAAWHFFRIFFGRHWLPGFANAALTASLGLGLLRLIRPPSLLKFSPLTGLRLRRLVLLISLYKGALFLILGDSMPVPARDLFLWGLQVPDPFDVVNLHIRTGYTIWHTTTITQTVSIILVALALLSLLVQAVAMAKLERELNVLTVTGNDRPESRVTRLWEKAVMALHLSHGKLPQVVMVDLPYPTPLLLGVRSARVLLSPHLADNLTDAELELAFRHELAHFQRRDHWWRWLRLWVESIAKPTLLAGWLGAAAVTAEEELCDRQAVLVAGDAFALAQAIRRSVSTREIAGIGEEVANPHEALSPLPTSVVPSLLGQDLRAQFRPQTLIPRLAHLLALAEELRARTNQSGSSPVLPPSQIALLKTKTTVLVTRTMRFCLRFLFGVMLFAVLYMK